MPIINKDLSFCIVLVSDIVIIAMLIGKKSILLSIAIILSFSNF
jgi:hypothetical protein